MEIIKSSAEDYNRKMITKEDDSFKTTANGDELLSNLQSPFTFLGLK
jgi:hypothetical protein